MLYTVLFKLLCEKMLNNNNYIKNSIFLEQNQFFHRTQAFASPTDMASSGVWENVILSKTPSFDGVCGMLSL